MDFWKHSWEHRNMGRELKELCQTQLSYIYITSDITLPIWMIGGWERFHLKIGILRYFSSNEGFNKTLQSFGQLFIVNIQSTTLPAPTYSNRRNMTKLLETLYWNITTSFARSATLGDTSWARLTTKLNISSWYLTDFQPRWKSMLEQSQQNYL